MIQEEEASSWGWSPWTCRAGARGYVCGRERGVAHSPGACRPDYRIDWTETVKYYERAKARLTFVVPLTLLLVFALLFSTCARWPKPGSSMLAVPFSLVGAVWILWILGYHLSVRSGSG